MSVNISSMIKYTFEYRFSLSVGLLNTTGDVFKACMSKGGIYFGVRSAFVLILSDKSVPQPVKINNNDLAGVSPRLLAQLHQSLVDSLPANLSSI